MDTPESRRRFLIGASATMGALATAGAVVPFVSYLKPSARAHVGAAPITVDVSGLEEGRLMRKLWRGKPIFIVHRTNEMIGQLSKITDSLADPNSQLSLQPDQSEFNTEYRALNPQYIVLVGVCTHLGCAPLYRPEIAPADLGEDWNGGFYCPCHGSKFDISGRVYKGVPAQTNLEIPRYTIEDSKIIIGAPT